MTHLIILRYLLAIYTITSPYIFIYLQQSVFRVSFDDEMGNRLIFRLHIISALASAVLFLATFDDGRALLK